MTPTSRLRLAENAAVHFTNGRIIDPFRGVDGVADLVISRGMIANEPPRGAVRIDAAGWIICPGLWDIHVHLREPGQGHKETIASGSAAAAAGGFTFVACMPNTNPAIDTPEIVRWIIDRARQEDICDVAPVAAITQGRRGQMLCDFAALRDAGTCAFSDDGVGVEQDDVMAAAFEAAARIGVVLIQHCEYAAISAGGVMHKGAVSARLGLPGLDPRSEEAMIERDLDLCRRYPARYHVAHISTARAVQLVRGAKAEGLPVTSEVTPHHLILTDEACASADPNTKMHPPLRSEADVAACRAGLIDGTIDCIATDHAPHTPGEKALGFLKAPAGIIGMETALGVSAKAMIDSGLADWPRLINWFTRGPARILGRAGNAIEPGAGANLTIIDPTVHWTVTLDHLQSKSRNTPFLGQTLAGAALATIRGKRMATTNSPLSNLK